MKASITFALALLVPVGALLGQPLRRIRCFSGLRCQQDADADCGGQQ